MIASHMLMLLGAIQTGLAVGIILVIFGFAFLFIRAERRRRK